MQWSLWKLITFYLPYPEKGSLEHDAPNILEVREGPKWKQPYPCKSLFLRLEPVTTTSQDSNLMYGQGFSLLSIVPFKRKL